MKARALGKEPVTGCYGCESENETMKKSQITLYREKEQDRPHTGWRFKAQELTSQSVNFTVILASITDFVTAEDSWVLHEAVHGNSEGTIHMLIH